MVTQVRKQVSIPEAERIILESKDREEMVQKLHSLPRRQRKKVVPDGGICLYDAEHKYGINNGTLSRWVKRGWVKAIQRTANWLYIDEADLIRAIREHRNGMPS